MPRSMRGCATPASPGPTGRLRKRARELFARALETPGGLKVQTIHALCTRLLQQFPFEANVPARFSVLDDRDQAEMIERASLGVLLEASANPESATGRALTFAMTCAADVTFRNIVHEACLGDGAFRTFIDKAESPEQAIASVAQALDAGSDNLADIEAEIVDGPHLPSSHWNAIAQNFDGGGKSDREQAAKLRAAVPLTGTAQVRGYLTVFLTNDNDPRVNLVSRSLARLQPGLTAALDREAARLPALIERWRAAMIRERTVALIAIASSILARYRAEKQERGLLDYDDLIDKTLDMLTRTAVGWVHYKLDRGIDHVLIDEAQDTSPKQWQIVTQLVADFATGRGVRDEMLRTIFAVGDEKQSIFSFQGAAPHEFDQRHRQFRRVFEGAGLKWDADIRLNYSFRSGRAILHSVDRVFREEAIYRSIHTPAIGAPIHEALADAAPGMIELWEMEIAEQRLDIEGWDAPFDAVSETNPEVKVATRVADTIAQMIASHEMTGRAGMRRPLTPGDVLILVRRRGKLFDAVIRALKHAHIAVAGADRLKLTEHIAIIDLMHLTDALLMPQDDLALAVALKSPLFGIGENQLYELCYQRKGSLRTALADRARTDLYFAEAHARLVACEEKAAQAKPFEFYCWLLGADGGRARMLKRLSHEANDAIDEFLELAFAFEQREVPSLQGFVAWLRAADTEIKRDMEIGRDEVRVMTVHGAKGLEAPVVFLMDTTSSPTDAPRLNLIKLPIGEPSSPLPAMRGEVGSQRDPGEGHGTDSQHTQNSRMAAPHPDPLPADAGRGSRGVSECVVWAGRKADDCLRVADARGRMVVDIEDEYRRLLYVAMTRAAERLIIGGVMPANRNKPRDDWWYQLITKGLEGAELTKEEFQTEAGKVTRFIRPDDSLAIRAGETEATGPAAPAEPPLPDWLRRPASPEQKPYETIRPSEPTGSAAPARWSAALAQARRHALHRGTLVHRLLQALPDIAPERRKAIAEDFAARNAKEWTADERAALVERTLELIKHPSFAALFAAGSRAEVPIIGQLTRAGRSPLLVSGQIDRLVIGPREVLIADFKTNEAPPKAAAAIPKTYVRQMALYAALMSQLYPDRSVRAALVWTETAEIAEIPPETLQTQLAAIISP